MPQSEPVGRYKDTKVRENIAELQVASHLLNHGILVAKPYFDLHGTDLIAMLQEDSNAQLFRMCRVQVKFRQAGNAVEIPAAYVTTGFICIVVAVPKETEEMDLNIGAMQAFDQGDIATWTKNKEDKYTRSFTEAEIGTDRPQLSPADLEKIKRTIRTAPQPKAWVPSLDFSKSENSMYVPLLLF